MMELETFLGKLGLLANTTDAVDKLRGLVLELAVQGKLSKQQDTDAKELVWLKLVQQLERDISTNKLEIEQPFEIPSWWRWSTLESLGDTKPRNDGPDNAKCSFVPMTLIPTEYGQSALHEVRVWGEIKKGYTHFQNGDVVMAKITPCFQNGKSVIIKGLTGGFGAGTTELHVFRRTTDGVLPEFVSLYLKTPGFIGRGIPRMTGTAGQKRIPSSYFSKSPIPLPPLAEQRRIVAKVDELMALCDRLEAQLKERDVNQAALAKAALTKFTEDPTPENLQLLFQPSYAITAADLRKCILKLAILGKLVPQDPKDQPPTIPYGGRLAGEAECVSRLKLPDTWLLARFDSILMVLKNGFNGKPNKVLSKFKITRIETIARETIDLSRVGYADSLPDDILNKHAVLKGDILFSHINSEPHLGKTAICTIDDPTLIHGVNLLLIRPIAGIDSAYLNITLRELRAAGYFVSIAQRAVNQASINQKNLGKTPIPIPPLSEQRQIVKRVEQLMILVDALERQLEASRTTGEKLLAAMVAELTSA